MPPETIALQHRYQTQTRRRLPGRNLPGWPTTLYYARLLRLITVSSRIAARGAYTATQWCRDSQHVIRIVESVGGRLDAAGMGRFAAAPGPFVFVANHMSMLDTFLLPGLILPCQKVTFVVKEALLHYPVFGAIMRAVGPIAVKREHPRQDLKQVMEQGRRTLANGTSIVVFPQATRSSQFDETLFNTLGVKLAARAGVQAVPVALKTDFQQNGRIIKEAGPIHPDKTVHIRFGAPVSATGGGQKAQKQIVDFIATHLARWQRPCPPGPPLSADE